jgi:hypothetical protein
MIVPEDDVSQTAGWLHLTVVGQLQLCATAPNYIDHDTV